MTKKGKALENLRADRGANLSESDIQAREPFVQPKLKYVKPTLIEHGDVKEITAGFFGSFYP